MFAVKIPWSGVCLRKQDIKDVAVNRPKVTHASRYMSLTTKEVNVLAY